ncbi:unnamed protein product [Urochloa humidicola]
MASIRWALLLLVAQLHTLLSVSIAHYHAHQAPFLCNPDHAKALLQLKKSFLFRVSTTRLSSWRNGTDCCLWEGVGCDAFSGHVTILDLNNRGLFSYGLDPAVFSLTSLRRLDLNMNDFGGYIIPATGFERFTFLTHLNLSNSALYGQVPIGISKLVNLVSLDLSSCPYIGNQFGFSSLNIHENYLWESNFDTLVANLSNLRELYLDSVVLSLNGEKWFLSLAKYVPKLCVLSLGNCGLRGPIHKSLSRLQSLVVINLQENDGITAGPFPEFFLDFLNLTVLRLSGVNLQGCFPSRPFQSKNLGVLDLSDNQNLSRHLPSFSSASSLETLILDGTNFSYARPTSSSNLKSLKVLSLDGNSFSVNLLSSLSTFGSLRELDLNLDLESELRSIFSWIGHYKNLTGLTLYGCNFSGITAAFVSNFKTVRSLRISYCNLPWPVLHAIGNLMGLHTLEMDSCTTHGSMPSSIGNLTNLRNLYIFDSVFSGPMTSAIGKLKNLRNMYIDQSRYSGPMPAVIGNLTNLKTMVHFRVQNSGSTIPYAIGQLKKLEWLNLADCDFSGRIPSSIANLTRLKVLLLGYNSLHGNDIILSRVFFFLIISDLHTS